MFTVFVCIRGTRSFKRGGVGGCTPESVSEDLFFISLYILNYDLLHGPHLFCWKNYFYQLSGCVNSSYSFE